MLRLALRGVALSDWRALTEDLPLSIEPSIERKSIPVPALTAELRGPRGDQKVLAGQYRRCERCLYLRPFGLLLGSRRYPVWCC